MQRTLTIASVSAALLVALAGCGKNDNGATDTAGGTISPGAGAAGGMGTMDTMRRDTTMMPPAGMPDTARSTTDTMSKKRP